MKLLEYIKNKGILRLVEVIYRYKIDIAIQKILTLCFKKKDLINAIVIESHNDFDCNGGSFYDYLIQNNYNTKYKIIWLIKNKMPTNLPHNVYAYKLREPSIMKDYYICRARFFTADNEVVKKVRKDQVSFYFTHGAIGLKNVQGLGNLPETVDYALSTSEYYAPILARQFGWNYPNPKMIELGYPCHDVFFKETENELKKITDKKYNKVFLWMPTFRKGGGFGRNDSETELPLGIPLIESIAMLKDLQNSLKQSNNLLIIKLHPMQDPSTYKDLQGMDNIIVLTGQLVKQYGVDNYRLLKAVDALISDYSSIVYSFLLLNKPIAFVLSDFTDYKLGFCVDNPEEYLVGHKIYLYKEFIDFMDDVTSGNDVYSLAREELMQKLYSYRDGESCRRIIEFMESL